MIKKKDVWNGESRGCGDVIFERLCIRSRTEKEYPVSEKQLNIYLPFAIQALVQYSEREGKNLATILEEEWIRGS